MRVAIVPARGGSKGIRMKNLHPVLGRPMMAYALEAAMSSRCERTFVSTDDHEIARFSESMGAEVVWRPPEMATDDSPTSDCVAHFLGIIGGVEVVVLVQATSPMVRPEDIDACLKMTHEGFDSAVTMTRTHDVLWRIESSGLKPVGHETGRRIRRQDVVPTYSETGSVYAFRAEAFIKHRSIPCGNVGVLEVEKIRSFQIDDLQDLEIVESIMSRTPN